MPVPKNRLVALTLAGAMMTAFVSVGLASPGLLPGIDDATAAQQPGPTESTTTASASTAPPSRSDSLSASVERDGEIRIATAGEIRPGETVTVVATRGGSPVSGAFVEVDGHDVGRTSADGSIQVPVRGDEFEVRVESDDARGRLEVEWDE